jgi:hypothetical protein
MRKTFFVCRNVPKGRFAAGFPQRGPVGRTRRPLPYGLCLSNVFLIFCFIAESSFQPAGDLRNVSRLFAYVRLSNFSEYPITQGRNGFVDFTFPELC